MGDDLFAVPPQVELGAHTLDVAVAPHADGVAIELRQPIVGSKRYRVLAQGVIADDEDAVLGWITFVAPGVRGRLDAEARLALRQAGYHA